MLHRSQHLQFCSVCKNRKETPDLGIVCQLTDKWADFEDSCEHFEKDAAVMEANLIRRKHIRKEKMKSDFVFGLDVIGIKNGFVAGTLLLLIGIVWLVIGLNAGYIFWYPAILIVMGVTAYIIAIFNSIRRSIERDQSSYDEEDEILDSDTSN